MRILNSKQPDALKEALCHRLIWLFVGDAFCVSDDHAVGGVGVWPELLLIPEWAHVNTGSEPAPMSKGKLVATAVVVVNCWYQLP